MEGASHIDLSGLRNRRLLNMDSEDEGIFLTSCAGGGRVDSKLEIKRETKSGVAVHVDLKGFTGGHSGIQIIQGGANANIMAGRVAAAVIEKTGAALIGMRFRVHLSLISSYLQIRSRSSVKLQRLKQKK